MIIIQEEHGGRNPNPECEQEMDAIPEGRWAIRCHARTPSDRWLCSLNLGHEGVHVATDSTKVLARWFEDG
jgi:hypothetical protein